MATKTTDIDYAALWKDCDRFFAANVAEEDYRKWFQPISFESYDPETCLLCICVPTEEHRETIETNFLKVLAGAIMPVFGKSVKLNYHILYGGVSVFEEGDKLPKDKQPKVSKKESTLPEIDSQLDQKLNFNNFIEGASNRLSRSVALYVGEHPRGIKFNPLFIYGPSGCGKTHLINAIGLRTLEMYPLKRVLYVSARTFEQQYSTAAVENRRNDFIAFYQTIDVLIVDDIQEWITSPKTQDTFFHIFDDLTRHSKRIILASDRAPAQLRGMHDRLISRFISGVTTEVEKPDTQLCKDILRNKISRDGLTFSDEVVDYIAETVNGSVRDLQGIINSLLLYSIVDKSEIDIHLAEKVVKKMVKVNDEPLTIDQITDAVSEEFGVTPQDINGKSRKPEFVLPRQVSMYLCQKLTNMESTRIGRLIGGRDHSTVLHSCQKVQKAMKQDSEFRARINRLAKELRRSK